MTSIDSAFETAGSILGQLVKKGKAELPQLGSPVFVVRGEHDHIEKVLRFLELPFQLVDPLYVNKADFGFGSANTVFVNCAGSKLNRTGLTHIRDYVESGGKLVTTDWAVEHVIQPLFPGTIRRHGSRTTGDEVVEVEPPGDLGAVLLGITEQGLKPKWWLESQSYPIEIDNPAAISVILTSAEMEKRHGTPYIAVAFPYGKGAVLHFVSHLKAQRTETRNARDNEGLGSFLEMTGTVQSPDMDSGATVAGLTAAFSTLHTVATIIREPSATFTRIPSGGKAYNVHLIAEGYAGVQFRGAREVKGLTARYDLSRGRVDIGRSSENAVVLSDEQVSRRHAQLYTDGKRCLVQDVGSSNGTYLGGKELPEHTPTLVPSGSTLSIGQGTLRIERV